MPLIDSFVQSAQSSILSLPKYWAFWLLMAKRGELIMRQNLTRVTSLGRNKFPGRSTFLKHSALMLPTSCDILSKFDLPPTRTWFCIDERCGHLFAMAERLVLGVTTGREIGNFIFSRRRRRRNFSVLEWIFPSQDEKRTQAKTNWKRYNFFRLDFSEPGHRSCRRCQMWPIEWPYNFDIRLFQHGFWQFFRDPGKPHIDKEQEQAWPKSQENLTLFSQSR